MSAQQDAINNLFAKINAAGATASAEELAYLSRAMESIGGKVSIFELAEFVATKTTEMTGVLEAARVAAIASINSTQSANLSAIGTARDQAVDTVTSIKNTSVTAINTTSSTAITTVNTVVTTGTDSINTVKTQAVADVAAAASSAVVQASSRGRLRFYARS